ncbi:MAG: DMT family transporter [Lawsonibacter sp.]|nr:DMT family transporter [Lawsonibacter sp.]
MKKEYLFAGISILFWGSVASINALMLGSLSSIHVIFYSSLIAALFLFLLSLFTGRLKLLSSISPKGFLYLGLLGMLGMFFTNLGLLVGQTYLKAQQALIINYIWPILVVLFSWPLLGQRMTVQKSAALLMSFLGVAVVAAEGNFESLTQISLPGLLACMTGAASYALFAVLNVKVSCDKFLAMLVYHTTATLASLLMLLAGGGALPALSALQWGGMLWRGILCNGLAYVTWALAMDIGDTAKLSNLAYLTPFVSLVYIYFLLHEPIAWSSYLGLFLILTGVLIQVIKRRPSSVPNLSR